MHKDTHTAVIIDCWMRKLGEITFENRPGRFDQFIRAAKDMATKDMGGELELVFGLEDTHGYGRNLAAYLTGHKYTVKSINPAYTNAIRLSAPTVFKDDSYDAYCVARVLRDMLETLPDAQQQDIFWTIRQLVKRRDSLVKHGTMLQNQLHGQLMFNYPSYRQFFSEVDTKSALFFWENYPSVTYLKNISPEELSRVLKEVYRGFSEAKAQKILSLAREHSPVQREYQQERDFIIRGIVREIRYMKQEIEQVDNELEKLIPITGYKLHTMPGINLNTASHIISEIGDINRFPNSDKLARFAGIAPVWFTSAGKGKEQSSRQGNRVLNGILYFLAVQLVQVSPQGKPRHPAFYDYYLKKQKEGKTKPQALVSIMRRAIRIIYGMMKDKSEYRTYEGSKE